MQAIHDYIIEIDKTYEDHITTDSGFKVHLDKRFNARELATTKGKVVAVPKRGDTDINVGDTVIFDNSFLIEQSYRGFNQGVREVANRDKNWYYVAKGLIYLYSGDGDTWTALDNNLLVEPLKEEKKVESKIILTPDDFKESYVQGRAKVVFLNQYLKDNDVQVGDLLYIKEERDIEVKVDNDTYWYIRNHDILGAEIK